MVLPTQKISLSPIPTTSTFTQPTLPATQHDPGTPTPNSLSESDILPTIYVDIAPDDMDRIRAKREEALEQWVLIASDADFVPAAIRLGNNPILRAKLRLKGDWADHFAGDKWSFRIQLVDDGTIMGMRVFSLQAPSTRAYLNEWLFLENLRAEDVLAVRYTFVKVVQNGEYKGIYALEEGFSKELFESLGRREGLMIRYNEDLLWQYWAEYENDLSTPRGVMDFHIIDEFQTAKISNDLHLSQQRDTAIGQLRGYMREQLPASDVFDSQTHAKFFALSDLWGAEHALQWHNLRFYYNPITTKLEPIGFDTQPLQNGTWVELNLLKGIRQAVQLDDPQLQKAYVQTLWEYTDPAYLMQVQSVFGDAYSKYKNALEPEYGTSVLENGQNVLADPWLNLETRQFALRELLQPLQMTYAYMNPESEGNMLRIDIGNLLDFPVEVLGIRLNGNFSPVQSDWISQDTTHLILPDSVAHQTLILKPLESDAQYMVYANLSVPAQVLPADIEEINSIELETRIWGLPDAITQTVLSTYPDPLNAPILPKVQNLNEVLVQHPYLAIADADNMLEVKPGEWEISGDLILPENYGLIINAGTTLKFSTGTLLLSHGPLLFTGTKEFPITLEPMDESWSGVVVLNAATTSYWSYVHVQSTNSVEREGWILTGGVTFYESDIHITHCIFRDSLGEDALNIVRSRFTIDETSFNASQFDAFDGDFTQGAITNSVFTNIAADGIDVSGSDITLEMIRMQSIGDKGVSVGESSRLTAFDIDIFEANFGIVSKDLSQAHIIRLKLNDIQLAGLAAYIKKTEFGPATIDAQMIDFGNLLPEQYTLVQTGSWIDLEQQRVWGSEIDIDALYNP